MVERSPNEEMISETFSQEYVAVNQFCIEDRQPQWVLVCKVPLTSAIRIMSEYSLIIGTELVLPQLTPSAAHLSMD